MIRYFSFTDDNSDKFWQIDFQDSALTVTFGKRGTAGQSQTKTFDSADQCRQQVDKLIREKMGKGYVESVNGQVVASPDVVPKKRSIIPSAPNADKEAQGAMLARYDELIRNTQIDQLLTFLQSVEKHQYEALRKKIKEARRYWCDYVEISRTEQNGHLQRRMDYRGTWPQRKLITLSGMALLDQQSLKPFDYLYSLVADTDKEYRDVARQILEWARPTWLADYLLQQSNQGGWQTVAYQTLRRLEANELVSYQPELFARSAASFSNWNSDNANRSEQTYRRHIESLATDERLWTRELPAFFEYATEIHTYTYAIQNNKKQWIQHPVWPLVFEQWLTEGKVDRLWFLERCLSVQTKDWNINLRAFFRKQVEAANPTTAELLALQPTLLPLLAAQHPHVVNWVVGLIKSISAEPSFQTADFLEWTSAVMMRADCKTGLKTLLSLLERIAKSGPTYRPAISLRLVDVFAINDLPLQTKAAQLLVSYGDPADIELQSQLQTFAGQMLGNVALELRDFLVDANTASNEFSTEATTYQYDPEKIVTRLLPDQAVTLPETWNDFLFLIGQFIASDDPFDAERLMNALILPPANMPTDFREQLRVYEKKLTKTYFQSHAKRYTGAFLLHWLYGGTTDFVQSDRSSIQTLNLQYTRLHHVRQKWKAGSKLPLLSLPTHAPHWIAPKTLVERLLAYQLADEAIMPLDLAIAIARMPREETTEALVLCTELSAPLAALMRYCLGGTTERTVPQTTVLDKLRTLFGSKTDLTDQQMIWAVAARTFEPDAEFTDFVQTSFADLPNVANPFTREIQVKEKWSEWRNYQTKQMERGPSWRELEFTLPAAPSILRPVLLYSNDLSDRQKNSWAFHSLELFDVAFWASLIPQQPESLFTMIAKYGSLYAESAPSAAHALTCLLQPGFRIRSMSMLVLATGLLAKKRETGALAAEGLIYHFGEQTLDASWLGNRLGWLLADNYAPVQRLSDALNLVRDVSPLHNKALLVMLDALFARLAMAQGLPKNTKKLLELHLDLLVKLGEKPAEEMINVLKTWQAVASLKKETAAILQKA
jgi:predicted DNA-binding WGR domain protein